MAATAFSRWTAWEQPTDDHGVPHRGKGRGPRCSWRATACSAAGRPAGQSRPGGERLEAFARRVTDAFERVRAAQPGNDMILVSHGGPIKALLCHVLGLEFRSLFRIKQDNTGVNLVEVNGPTRRVVLVNDTCHLTDAGAELAPQDVLTDAGAAGDQAL